MLATETLQACYHCGADCNDEPIEYEDKSFCCQGCKTVFQILEENNLCQYYDIEKMSGNVPSMKHFEFLDNPDIVQQLIDFQDDNIAKVTFYIPAIHCSSCLYLLENLTRLHEGFLYSRVDFLKKQVYVTYNPQLVSLRLLAETLTTIGYEPLLSMANTHSEKKANQDSRSLILKLGIAGFCAGNIMLFSFPEYLGLQDATYRSLFGYFNLILSIPVVGYAASGYFDSVFKSLRKGVLTIEFPILLSIVITFLTGAYQVLSHTGAGYFDSLTGLVFFLLIGKWFQQKTYTFLSFERDYKSYFPMAATLLKNGKEVYIPLNQLKKGDKILIRNAEIIPADALLYEGDAQIDYSFVTGESALDRKMVGDLLYAGGRQRGGTLKVEVLKEVSHSYLTQLWNQDTFQKEQLSLLKTFSNQVSRYFTPSVLALALLVAGYWSIHDSNIMLYAFVSVLIIACPCTLALSYPFALGNGLRLLGKHFFYLKNGEIIEQLAQCDTIVFDKTGTLTTAHNQFVEFYGKPLNDFEKKLVASLTYHSTHPIAKKIYKTYAMDNLFLIENFKELIGNGIEGIYEGKTIRLGIATFVGIPADIVIEQNQSISYLSINEEFKGYFGMLNQYRNNIEKTLRTLKSNYQLYLLSGDNETEKTTLSSYFGVSQMLFHQTPQDKLTFIKTLQTTGKKVIMIGDGLNDAGALKQANVGIAITEDTLNFTPMSDAILEAKSLNQLPNLLDYCHFGVKLIKFSYLFSLFYNCIGLTFAMRGVLSPIIAAILMPLNSITLVSIASLGMIWKGKSMLSRKKL